MKKYTYTGTEALSFSLGDKDFFIAPGDKVELPENEMYVAGLVSSGKLTEVAKKTPAAPAAAAGTGTASN